MRSIRNRREMKSVQREAEQVEERDEAGEEESGGDGERTDRRTKTGW